LCHTGKYASSDTAPPSDDIALLQHVNVAIKQGLRSKLITGGRASCRTARFQRRSTSSCATLKRAAAPPVIGLAVVFAVAIPLAAAAQRGGRFGFRWFVQ
jgi:hypothetical protein